MSNDSDDVRALPGEDAVHHLILRRMEQMEKAHAELDRWRVKADIMLDNVAHLETRFDALIERQTTQILGELGSVKRELGMVVKDQTFWANSRTIAKWVVGASVPIVIASWAVFTFFYKR